MRAPKREQLPDRGIRADSEIGLGEKRRQRRPLRAVVRPRSNRRGVG